MKDKSIKASFEYRIQNFPTTVVYSVHIQFQREVYGIPVISLPNKSYMYLIWPTVL